MKTLILLRHAKSSWDHPGLSDSERPLAARGKRACRALGVPLRPLLEPFDDEAAAICCSPARRARATLKRVLKSAGLKRPFTLEDALYTFDGEALWNWCRSLPEHQQRVLVVGHNPALEQLAQRLVDAPSPALPTGACIGFELAVERWAELAPGCGRLLVYFTPRALVG